MQVNIAEDVSDGGGGGVSGSHGRKPFPLTEIEPHYSRETTQQKQAIEQRQNEDKSDQVKLGTSNPRYMRIFYLQFHVYAIEIMAFQRNTSSNSPLLYVLVYANLLYANQAKGTKQPHAGAIEHLPPLSQIIVNKIELV